MYELYNYVSKHFGHDTVAEEEEKDLQKWKREDEDALKGRRLGGECEEEVQ